MWASETDAEIVKDLEFFMNFEVVHEAAVFDDAAEDALAAEVAETPAPVGVQGGK